MNHLLSSLLIAIIDFGPFILMVITAGLLITAFTSKEATNKKRIMASIVLVAMSLVILIIDKLFIVRIG